MNHRHIFLAAFVTTVACISYQSFKKCHALPWPPQLIFAGAAFILIDVFSLLSEELAALMALGIVVAALVQQGFVTDCIHLTKATAQPAIVPPTAGQPTAGTGGTLV